MREVTGELVALVVNKKTVRVSFILLWIGLCVFFGGVILTPTPQLDPSGTSRFPPPSPWSPITLVLQSKDMKENPRVRFFAPETALSLKRAEQQILHGVSITVGGFAFVVFGVPYMKVMLTYGVLSTLHSAISYLYERPGPGLLKLASWWYSMSVCVCMYVCMYVCRSVTNVHTHTIIERIEICKKIRTQ